MRVNFFKELNGSVYVGFYRIRNLSDREKLKLLFNDSKLSSSNRELSRTFEEADGSSFDGHAINFALTPQEADLTKLFHNDKYVALKASLIAEFPALEQCFQVSEQEIVFTKELNALVVEFALTNDELRDNKRYFMNNMGRFHSNSSNIHRLEARVSQLEVEKNQLSDKITDLQRQRDPVIKTAEEKAHEQAKWDSIRRSRFD